MKKRFLAFVSLVLVMCLLSGCCLIHSWDDATCIDPKTCSKCGETEGEPLGHEWDIDEATCTRDQVCTECGEIGEKAPGHRWDIPSATCTEDQHCTVCGETESDPLAHTWTDATCAAPKTCSLCGKTEGKPLPHTTFLMLLTDTVRTDWCAVCNESFTSEVTNLNKEAMELLTGTWKATHLYEGPEGKAVDMTDTITFEFQPNGTVVANLPDNAGTGTFRFGDYDKMMGRFTFEAKINGVTYDVIVYMSDPGVIRWPCRDRNAVFFCSRQ